MIELTILIIALVCISFYAGWWYREHVARVIIEKHFKAAEVESAKNTLRIDVTENDDTYLVHDHKTGAFITQVRDKEQMIKFFEDTYNNVTILATQDDMNKFVK